MNPSEPFLTVIIPARNRATLLRRTLASVGAQSYRNFRVVLVDNGSRDSTREVMARWADSQTDLDVTVADEPRAGATRARNAGTALATTPWLMFFDSDDEMLPDHIADFRAAAEASPEAEIIGRGVLMRTPDGRDTRKFFTARRPLFNHIFHSTLSTQRYIVRSEFYRRHGGWDTRAVGWDDWEMGLRLLLGKPRLAEIRGESVVQHVHGDSITGTDFSSSPRKWADTIDLCRADVIAAGRADLLPLLDMRRMSLAAIFAAEVYGIPMPLDRQLTVILLAVLASIGSMGVPGAALIMLSMIFTHVGIPLEAIALVDGIDRVMDMARTTINVLGDATAAIFISRTENDFDPQRGAALQDE